MEDLKIKSILSTLYTDDHNYLENPFEDTDYNSLEGIVRILDEHAKNLAVCTKIAKAIAEAKSPEEIEKILDNLESFVESL